MKFPLWLLVAVAWLLAIRPSFAQTNYDDADWQNPLVFGINKLPPRNPAWPNPDAASAWQSDYDHSPWVLPLNGAWAFHWAPNPDLQPAEFYSPDFNAADWKQIAVPSCWQLLGYGTPIYTNYRYPFNVNHPGQVMNEPRKDFTSYKERNAVGSYRRTFQVPAEWGVDGRTLLHFAGVSSAMYVWVNGQKVGYSQDSRLPAEFDITPYLKPGDNLLAVEVYRWSDGSYLEDQDMWRLSGIFRDVFLYHTPPVSLWDFYVDAPVDEACKDAAVTLGYTLRNLLPVTEAASGSWRIRLSLRGPDGKIVGGGPLVDEAVGALAPDLNPEKITASIPIKNPLLWSEEIPNVYDALVELVDDGKVIEARRADVGFRRIDVREQQLCLNGRPFKIKGINRHESSPVGGYAITQASRETDLRLIKQANLNFVRTSHYPNDPRWYSLCNRWGMLLMDENNMETHGLSYSKKVLPGDDPKWEPAVVDRMRRMVIRDRGQPSVVMWSLGNEAGYGHAFLSMREAARAADPQKRLIHYADMNLAADVDSQTYPTTQWLLQHVAGKAVRKGEHDEIGLKEQHGPYPSGKPFLANEYAHAEANSLGNLQDYWDVFDKYPMLWGGFIWEWADQTLNKITEDGKVFPAYGGDFGDRPNDGKACVKGLVSADRLPRPHYWEAKKVFQAIKTLPEDASAGRVRVRNKYSFTSLGGFAAEWVLEENGSPIAEGRLEGIDTAPGEEQVVTIPWGQRAWKPGSEYFLTVKFRRRADTPWATAGDLVAWDQIPISVPSLLPMAVAKTGPAASVSRDGEDWVASAGGTTLRVDGRHGWLISFSTDGRERLAAPLLPNFWRVPTDNDIGWKVPETMAAWKTAGLDAKLLSLAGKQTEAGALVTAAWALPVDASTVNMTYLLRGNGSLRIEMQLEVGPHAPELPRVGVQFAIPRQRNSVRWFGRGPQENYRDRNTGAAVGLYESVVDKWITPYVRPQDNANRTDMRWLELSGADGVGLRVRADGQNFAASAWPYSTQDLESATHDYQLPRRDTITVNVDGFQMGVGGDTSWGLPVHEEYRLRAKGNYHFAFDLEAMSSRGTENR